MTQAQQLTSDVLELPRTFSVEEQEAMLGKLVTSDPDPLDPNRRPTHYMTLDEAGTPTGQVSVEVPPPDVPFISVMAAVPVDPDLVTTLSGAPLTTQMNPAHSTFDAGLEERNPTPESPMAPRSGHSLSAKTPAERAAAEKARQEHLKHAADDKKKAEEAAKAKK